jgi:hypothetical protein
MIKLCCKEGMDLFGMESGYKYEIAKMKVRFGEVSYLSECERDKDGSFDTEGVIEGIKAFES